MSEQDQHNKEILPKTESQSVADIEEKTLAALSEAEAASNLSNALKQTTTGVTDFTQQTLIDVNSQPLIHNLMGAPQLLGHPSLDASSSQAFLSPSAPILLQPEEEPTNTENSGTQHIAMPMDETSPLLTEFYERFAQGRMFQTLEELRTAAYDYGRKHNVALTTSKSDKTKVYLICKHGGHYRKNNKRPQGNKQIKPRVRRSQKTGCACMIYARCCRGSFWIVRKSIGEHNHPIADDPRTYAMYRSLSPEHLLMVHRMLREHVGVSYIVKSLKNQGVTNILAKDIENIQQDLKRRDVLDIPVTTDTNESSNMAPVIDAITTITPTTIMITPETSNVIATTTSESPTIITPLITTTD